MDFEELHGKSGSGTNVGVDLTTLMTSQIAVSTAGESGGGGSGSGDMAVPRIASFQVYWDVQGKQFKVFSPKVVDPSGSEIKVTETALSRGTYVCEVKKGKTTNVYTAAIKLIDSIVPSAETVTVVKLFKIEDGKVEQYHVGVIAVDAATIKGDIDGSEAVPLSGAVEITGADENGNGRSGIVFKTVKGASGKPAKLYCDVSGRKGLSRCEHQNGWGAHEVKFYDSDGTERRFHFLGCRDVTLPGGSGGGGVTSLYEPEYVGEKATGNVQLKGTDGIEIDVTPAVKDGNGGVITDATVNFSIGETLLVESEDETVDATVTLSALRDSATQTVKNRQLMVETSATDSEASCNAMFGNNTSSILKASGGGATCDLVTGSDKVSLRAFGNGRATILLVGNGGTIGLDTSSLGGKSVAIHDLKVVKADGTSVTYKVLANDNITLVTGGGGGGKRLVDVSFRVDTDKIVAEKKFVDENGNESTKEAIVCTLTTKDVVTGSTYDCPNFTISKSSVTVVGGATDLDDETVFTSTAHSAET